VLCGRDSLFFVSLSSLSVATLTHLNAPCRTLRRPTMDDFVDYNPGGVEFYKMSVEEQNISRWWSEVRGRV